MTDSLTSTSGKQYSRSLDQLEKGSVSVFRSDYSQLILSDEQSALNRYYLGLLKAQEIVNDTAVFPTTVGELFSPADLPQKLPEELRRFFSAGKMHFYRLQPYKGHSLNLIDLRSHLTVQSTKWIPSLCMVARAICHIQSTGENILMVVPTSANKGQALRVAVERAISLGLVKAEQLRILMLLPYTSKGKLRSSTLYTDPYLRKLNPIVLYKGESSAALKRLAKDFEETFHEDYYRREQTRLWYTLNLKNYMVADAARAFFEFEQLKNVLPYVEPNSRVIAQAVSSAYGLLGHRLGCSVLEKLGFLEPKDSPGYFLVQQLSTPDMVVHHRFGSFCRNILPDYKFDDGTGCFRQQTDPHFPFKTHALDEEFDSTFYTKEPPTAEQMSKLISQFGGGGIVVSLAECLERYKEIKQRLEPYHILLPANPKRIRDWALVKCFTGVLNAIDRNLLNKDVEVSILGTGFSTSDCFSQISENDLPMISQNSAPRDLRDLIK